MIQKILKSVTDFEDRILDGTIKACMLRENSKIAQSGWSVFVNYEDLYEPFNSEKNLGISLVGPNFPGDKILTCIDIDGDKRNNEIEQFSKDLAYNMIREELDKENIKYMAIKSSSGGYHIYIYTIEESMRYESTKGLIYPEEISDATETISMFLRVYKKQFDEIAGDNVPKGIVEIWSSRRYMVAPGSDIYENGKYIGTTTLLPDGVQAFKDIGFLEKNLNDFIRNTFTKNGFKEDETQEYSSQIATPSRGTVHLDPFDIQSIGDLILDVYPKIDGQKHTATLSLGGYLKNRGISQESMEAIGNYVIDNAPKNLFKNPYSFISTLTHDIVNNDPTREKIGLPTFEEILEDHYDKEYIGRKLHISTKPVYHTFWPSGRFANTFDEITINHKQNSITRFTKQNTLTKNGEIKTQTIGAQKLKHDIKNFYKINDISSHDLINDWEQPIQITFQTYKSDIKESPIYENPDELFRGYRKIEGAYSDKAKSIIEDIYREYESLNYIKEKNISTRPGYWLDNNTIRKFTKTKNNVFEDTPEKPTKKQLKKALKLLEQINEAFPWQPGKFGAFIRSTLTLPYTNIFKYHFNKHHKSIVLYGTAGTLKTTAAELALFIHTNPHLDESTNIVGGGELNSEFRFGRAMDSSSFPIVANEAEYLFSRSKVAEIIKDAVTGTLIRKPGSKNPQSYFANRGAIYTMNNLSAETEDPAFIRRFIPFEFDETERGDIPEVIEKLSFLNKNGINNYKFKELQTIGDYIFHKLNQNQQWFSIPIETTQMNLIIAMEEETGLDLSYLKEDTNKFINIDRIDHDNYKLNLLLKIFKIPYWEEHKKYLNGADDEAIIKNMIERSSAYSFAHFTNKGEILLDIELKHIFNNRYEDFTQSVTLKGCFNLLKQLSFNLPSLRYGKARVDGRKKQVRGIILSIEDFLQILQNNS